MFINIVNLVDTLYFIDNLNIFLGFDNKVLQSLIYFVYC